MLDANAAGIANAYLKAMKGGDDRPVIAVFDMKEQFACELALDLVGRQIVSEAVANAACDEVEEAFIWTLPHGAAMKGLGSLAPNGPQELERLIALDLLPVAVITCGAILWAGFPKPYIESLRPTPQSREK